MEESQEWVPVAAVLVALLATLTHTVASFRDQPGTANAVEMAIGHPPAAPQPLPRAGHAPPRAGVSRVSLTPVPGVNR